MRKEIFLVVFCSLAFTSFCTSPVLAWDFDKMIAHVEKKLPIAEKQAVIIIKMLNSDKHLAELQSDIDRIRKRGPVAFKATDTYLYKVLGKIENGTIAFEKSALDVLLIWGNRKNMDKSIQPLSPLFLVSFARGDYNGMLFNEIRSDKDFLKNKEKADALVGLCKKLMEIQKSVLFLAREKLNIDGIGFAEDKKGGVWTPKLSSEKAVAMDVYGFLFPVSLSSGETVYYDAVMHNEDYLVAYPISYIKYLQIQANFLMDLGFKTSRDPDWNKYIEELGKILENKAESFDDLKLDGKKETQIDSKNKDLDLDDLKLPE